MTATAKVGVLNYGLGNVGSMLQAIGFYGYDTVLIEDEAGLNQSDAIIMAGVGNFTAAVKKLQQGGWVEALTKQALEKQKTLLGVCLGMQLFATVSEEASEEGNTEVAGLGWIPGRVVKMEAPKIRVPHIGWNDIQPENTTLFDNLKTRAFYFMHSYHFAPEKQDAVMAKTQYGDLNFVSAVRQNNIVGVQFHPEKSQGDGLRFLRNFLKESLN